MLLPFIISFAVLILIILVLLTYLLDFMNKDYQCNRDPKIWCSDSLRCTVNCTDSKDPSGNPVSTCFNTGTNKQGLASCLFGSDSTTSHYCLPETPPPAGQPLCNCNTQMQGAQNCMAQCSRTLNAVTAPCCCTTGPNCANCAT